MNTPRNTQTAVLIFAASGSSDSRAKGINGSSFLFEALTARTVQTVKQSGLSYYIFNEKQQQGATFGERLTHAIDSVYNLGYDNVIAIGNDTPQLTPAHLIETNLNLQHNKTTIGPSKDGGFYLLGLNRLAFAKAKVQNQNNNFSKLSWHSASLLEGLITLLDSNVELLQTLMDLDSIDDIREMLRQSQLDQQLLQLLLLVLKTGRQISNYQLESWCQLAFMSFYNKGSPC